MSNTTETPAQYIAENYLNKGLVTASGCLSVFGSSIIILTYLAWKSIRTTSRLLLVYISVGDFLTAGTNVLSSWHSATGDISSPKCIAAATVNTIAVLSTFFWTTFLAIYLYLVICKQMESNTEVKVLFVFRIVGWGVPAIVVLTALGLNKIGNTGDFTSAGWCWIKSYNPNNRRDMVMWMFLAGKGWELLAYIAILVFYVKLMIYLSKKMKTLFCSSPLFINPSARKAARKTLWKFAVIPIIFIFLRMWGTIRFFRYITRPESDNIKWLIFMHGIGDNLQGFANFLLFCLFTNKIRSRFQLACSRILPCCKPKETTPLGLEDTEKDEVKGTYGSMEKTQQNGKITDGRKSE